LPGYDYSQEGSYFITIVTKDRECLFGKAVAGEMELNECGCVVEQCWADIPKHFPNVELGEFVVMPQPFARPSYVEIHRRGSRY
jgi:REP element-mobilizing transposase RayT